MGQPPRGQPPAAVVFAGRHASRGGDARGPVQVIPAAADVSCGYVNFFSSAASAAAWASGHPEATGDILGHAAALRLGTAIFGPLPPDLAADTPMKRRVDRLLPRSGLPTVACFAAVIGLLSLAPHLPVRADLAADGLAALAGAAWCGVNFWRCRHAHCAVTSTGWLVLCILAFAGTGVGHSLISGYEQPVFLAVLGAALAFEIVWRRARGTGALGPGVSHQHSDSQAPHS